MELTKETTSIEKQHVLSLLFNISLGIIIYGMIRFVTFGYFDSFWTNWVLFVSGITIAFMIWYKIDPLQGDRTWSRWITRAAGVTIFLVLALVIGF